MTEVRFIKLVNGEELIGQTDGKVDKDGYIKIDKMVRLLILPPNSPAEQPMISFADYAPYAFPVDKNPENRKAKWFRADQLLHPPMEVQDQLLSEYHRLFSPIDMPNTPKIIL